MACTEGSRQLILCLVRPMKRIALALFTALLFVHFAHASREVRLPTALITVTITTAASEASQLFDLGEVRATYSYSPHASGPKLREVSVAYRQKVIPVPRESIAEHPDIIVDSGRLSCERGHGPQPVLYLTFDLRSEPRKRFLFSFTEGKFDRTSIHPEQ